MHGTGHSRSSPNAAGAISSSKVLQSYLDTVEVISFIGLVPTTSSNGEYNYFPQTTLVDVCRAGRRKRDAVPLQHDRRDRLSAT